MVVQRRRAQRQLPGSSQEIPQFDCGCKLHYPSWIFEIEIADKVWNILQAINVHEVTGT